MAMSAASHTRKGSIRRTMCHSDGITICGMWEEDEKSEGVSADEACGIRQKWLGLVSSTLSQVKHPCRCHPAGTTLNPSTLPLNQKPRPLTSPIFLPFLPMPSCIQARQGEGAIGCEHAGVGLPHPEARISGPAYKLTTVSRQRGSHGRSHSPPTNTLTPTDRP